MADFGGGLYGKRSSEPKISLVRSFVLWLVNWPARRRERRAVREQMSLAAAEARRTFRHELSTGYYNFNVRHEHHVTADVIHHWSGRELPAQIAIEVERAVQKSLADYMAGARMAGVVPEPSKTPDTAPAETATPSPVENPDETGPSE